MASSVTEIFGQEKAMSQMPPNMLGYTIKGGLMPGDYPQIYIGQGSKMKSFSPSSPVNDSYWFYFLDSKNPQTKVYDLVVPGSANTTVPAGLDTYMNNPDLLFGVVTQNLNTLHVPQGALYTFLTTYGAGRALQKLEQINSSMSCGYFGHLSYALIGQGGHRGGPNPPPPSYEAGSLYHQAMLEMSLMPQMNGQPPYSICDCNTF
jgi:hypothetical protein